VKVHLNGNFYFYYRITSLLKSLLHSHRLSPDPLISIEAMPAYTASKFISGQRPKKLKIHPQFR
jgi:hypothetical protein